MCRGGYYLGSMVGCDGDAMITVLHKDNAVSVLAFYHEGRAMFKGTPQHRKPLEMVAYLIGKAKPNYPMPAVIDYRDPEWYWMISELVRINMELKQYKTTQ